MYTPPWIPRADASFRQFAESFCTTIHDSPAAYGMTPAQSNWLMQLLGEFNAAYAVATNPVSRTRGTIAAKDDARSNLQNSIQNYGAHIRANLGIPDGDKLSIGVRPRNTSHQQRKCPNTAPLLDLVAGPLGSDWLIYHDANTPGSRAKPRGAMHVELYMAFALPGAPHPKREDAKYVGPFKKNPIRVPHDVEQDALGARPIYWARWRGFDGRIGPWSLKCSVAGARIQAAPTHSGSNPERQGAQADQSLKKAA